MAAPVLGLLICHTTGQSEREGVDIEAPLVRTPKRCLAAFVITLRLASFHWRAFNDLGERVAE